MWAYALTAPGQLSRCETTDIATAAVRSGEVVARLLAGAICGSDLPNFRGGGLTERQLPGFPLHEVVGEVVASAAPDIEVGARVVGWAGGFQGLAEYFTARAEQLHVLDTPLDDVHATVAQPLATVLCALQRVPEIAGRRAAVIGQGPLGLLFSHVLNTCGAAPVIGVDRVDRADVADKFGVSEPVWDNSERWARQLSEAGRPEIVVEAVGHQAATLNDAIHALAPGGFLFAFGVPDDEHYAVAFRQLFRKNGTLAAGGTTNWRHWLERAVAYLHEHPELADNYVTHVFAVSEAQRAFELAATPARGRLKVVLRPED
ncbi:zinc-binding dehydrogenase [Saccharopolyspora sp. K220]|uniref:zinc-binding dehydrogenase n=1 Tax=Saccharopolyspora soli TaxID=2926618 RepID=UPI001F574ECD|nr:zinc-binding dehydrogenase [Saccharopolyspora soli]MCI2417297.1 zinc-binding dehydrogenase [Saccharopolyspora soli]